MSLREEKTTSKLRQPHSFPPEIDRTKGNNMCVCVCVCVCVFACVCVLVCVLHL